MMFEFYGQFDPPLDKVLYETYPRGVFCRKGRRRARFQFVLFEKYRGWHGINIDDPVLFKRLAANRPDSKNLNIALWSSMGGRELHTSKVVGHASLKPELMISKPEDSFTVLCLTWDVVVQTGVHVDLLSLDVEGAELEVISGMSRSLPDVICVEHPQSGIENLERVLGNLVNESEGSFRYALDKLTDHNAFFVKRRVRIRRPPLVNRKNNGNIIMVTWL
jgi:FkbM family methyltransferase